MSSVTNPKHREPRRGDYIESPAGKAYFRLRALPEGESFLKAVQLRELFGVNGEATHARIGEKLRELRKRNLVSYQQLEVGGRVAYRIVLELLPEEMPDNGLEIPQSITEDMTEAQQVAIYFRRLENARLGIKTLFSIKDWQNARRLLKDNSLDVVKRAITMFWETKADQRKNPNFNEFYIAFPRLANDARDEIEVERSIKLDKLRKEQPAETHRDYLIREIKYQQKRNPERAKNLQKELEELDGEED